MIKYFLIIILICGCAIAPENNLRTGVLSPLTFIVGDEAFISIYSIIQISDVTQLWNDFSVLEKTTDIRSINLFINSPGGDAFSGLALTDQIERAQHKGFTITAYASGIVASAALPVFAVCDRRLAAPGTIFMMHEAYTENDEEPSHSEMLAIVNQRYIAKLVSHSIISENKWKKLAAKTSWFCVTQAKEWGLIDKIE